MKRYHRQATVDEAFGPATDLVISLFCVSMVLGAIAAAHQMYQDQLKGILAEQKRAREELEGKVIVLQDLPGGFQYFERESAKIEDEAVAMIRERLKDLRQELETARGRFVIYVIGHVSPEPFKVDSGLRNFDLALSRARSIAVFLHDELHVPYECVRVQGAGRAESAVLGGWLSNNEASVLGDWDTQLRQRAAIVEEHLLVPERRVEVKRQMTRSPVCARALGVL